jgi:hypothetical protein
MKHHHVILGLSACLLSATAMAGDDADRKHAGDKGYVSAYEADKTTIIDVDRCPVTGRLATPDYVACGKPFRDKVKATVCSKKGAGKHSWFYQIGNSNTFSSQTANCK